MNAQDLQNMPRPKLVDGSYVATRGVPCVSESAILLKDGTHFPTYHVWDGNQWLEGAKALDDAGELVDVELLNLEVDTDLSNFKA